MVTLMEMWQVRAQARALFTLMDVDNSEASRHDARHDEMIDRLGDE